MTHEPYRFFYVNPAKCIGCQLCEYACALKKTGQLNPLHARIRVIRMHPFINLALTCKLCEDPPCVTACPRDALSQDEATRVIQVDDEKCDGCGWCIEACPYGAIRYDIDDRTVLICDLCDGEPECQAFCPVEAIEFTSSNAEFETAWSTAYQKWAEEARKFVRMTEQGDLDVFHESTATIEKIEDKLRQLVEKYISPRRSTRETG